MRRDRVGRGGVLVLEVGISARCDGLEGRLGGAPGAVDICVGVPLLQPGR
jgi:hypothetical protein